MNTKLAAAGLVYAEAIAIADKTYQLAMRYETGHEEAKKILMLARMDAALAYEIAWFGEPPPRTGHMQ